MYMYVSIQMPMFMYMHMYMYMYMYAYAYVTNTYTHTRTHTYTYTQMYLYMYMYMSQIPPWSIIIHRFPSGFYEFPCARTSNLNHWYTLPAKMMEYFPFQLFFAFLVAFLCLKYIPTSRYYVLGS